MVLKPSYNPPLMLALLLNKLDSLAQFHGVINAQTPLGS